MYICNGINCAKYRMHMIKTASPVPVQFGPGNEDIIYNGIFYKELFDSDLCWPMSVKIRDNQRDISTVPGQVLFSLKVQRGFPPACKEMGRFPSVGPGMWKHNSVGRCWHELWQYTETMASSSCAPKKLAHLLHPLCLIARCPISWVPVQQRLQRF